MRFCSTKSGSPLVSYKDAAFDCLPADGGLYIPARAIDFRQFFLHMDNKTSFNELVSVLTPSFFESSLNPVSASRFAEKAFTFQPELTRLDENLSLLNLYNGPTGNFKDFGMAFMSAMFDEFLEKDERIVVLVSARPDAGSSAARAFRGRKDVLLVLVYPFGQLCGLDSSSLLQNGGNIIPVQIKGNFDDCQRLVIETILDRDFSRRYKVTSADSINVGGLLPQIFYFLYAFIQIKNSLSGDFFFSVPSGNFGSLVSGLYAWKFGMPVNGFIAAMNANNSLGEYFLGRPFAASPRVITSSPALDVSFPVNYERLESFYKETPAVMRNMVFPVSVDDSLTLKTMEEVHENYNILIDPHTAVAFAAAEKIITRNKMKWRAHTIVLATGRPANPAGPTEETDVKAGKTPDFSAAPEEKIDSSIIIPPQVDSFQKAITGCL